MTSNYSLMTKPSLEEITKKIDQFLSTLPSDSLGCVRSSGQRSYGRMPRTITPSNRDLSGSL